MTALTQLQCGLPFHLGDLAIIGPMLAAAWLGLRMAWHRVTCWRVRSRACSNHRHEEHPHP